mgnify:CR=1 FL=1
MLFCDVCENMMYITLDEENKLQYKCKNCMNALDASSAERDQSLVLRKSYIDDETKYKQYVNPNIKYDPTLPRVNAIPCANPNCTKPRGEDNEVIYVKYDKDNLRFMYYCCFCETFWKSR